MADKDQKVPSALDEGEAPAPRWLTPLHAGAWVWVETLVLTLLAMGFGWLANPAAPFFIDAQFPWPWFAPALIALRYGVGAGVTSSALLLLGWSAWSDEGLGASLPKLYFLGGLLLVMVSGEYSGIWRTRLHRMAELNLYLEDRMERVTRRLYLLRLSHDRLEQDILSKPTTLRDALSELRLRLSGRVEGEALPGAQNFLEFLAQTCQLEVAAIYYARGDLQRSFLPVADVGDVPPLKNDDPLLAYSLEHGKLAHVQTSALGTTLPTAHLVVAPIYDSSRKLLGVLVVSKMPFFALKEETLQLMSVLLSAYADGVSAAELVLPLLASFPGIPTEFAEELVKLTRIEREFHLASHIVVLEFGQHRERPDMYQQVLRQRRTPDVIWNLDDIAGRSFIINLMPLAGQAAVDGYLLRTESVLQAQFGGNFQALAIRAHAISLSDPDPLAHVKRVLIPRA